MLGMQNPLRKSLESSELEPNEDGAVAVVTGKEEMH